MSDVQLRFIIDKAEEFVEYLGGEDVPMDGDETEYWAEIFEFILNCKMGVNSKYDARAFVDKYPNDPRAIALANRYFEAY